MCTYSYCPTNFSCYIHTGDISSLSATASNLENGVFLIIFILSKHSIRVPLGVMIIALS